jgi:hypothetical protein
MIPRYRVKEGTGMSRIDGLALWTAAVAGALVGTLLAVFG